MRQTTILVLAILLATSALGGDTTVAVPITVSPGSIEQMQPVSDPCPTFSWGAAGTTSTFELAVYRIDESAVTPTLVLRQRLPGTASSWTPSADRCLEPGRHYAWAVRAVGGETASAWSPPSLFLVAAVPSAAKVEQAAAVLERYLASIQETGEMSGPAHRPATRASNSTPTTATRPPASPDTAPAAVRAELVDTSGEVYGVTGITHSADGAALIGQNTADGPDLILAGDGVAPDAVLTESGITRTSDETAEFTITNPGAGKLELITDELVADWIVGVQEIHADYASIGGIEALNVVADDTFECGECKANTLEVEYEFVCAGCIDEAALSFDPTVASSGDSATGFFPTGQIEEPRIADEIARDTELFDVANLPGLLCTALAWRYIDLGDGTILDCNTDLIWLKDASCIGEWPYEDGSNPNAFDKLAEFNSGTDFGCADYTPGTFSDWELPVVTDLCTTTEAFADCPLADAPLSLIDSSVSAPKVTNARGNGGWTESDAFVGVQANDVWSGTQHSASHAAWQGNLLGGFVGGGVKTNNNYVWPVRGRP